MNIVDPIKSKHQIKIMYQFLQGKNPTLRNATIFLLGISFAYRISDLLQLKCSDLFANNEYRFKEYIHTIESKKNKHKRFVPPEKVKKAIKKYAAKNKLTIDDWLFPSKSNRSKHLDRSNAWRFLSQAAREVGIVHIGSHSLRKTWGYHYYIDTKDIRTIMRILNHDSESDTLRYIGWDQEIIDEAMGKMTDIYDL